MKFLSVVLVMILALLGQAQAQSVPGGVPGWVPSTSPGGLAPITWGLFGSSLASQADEANAGTGTCPFSTTNCFSYFNGAASGTFLNLYLNKRLARPSGTGNYGVSGDTTSGMLARIGAVLANHYDVIFIKGGGDNDVANNVACPTIVANYQAIWTAFPFGTKIIQDGLYPRGGSVAYTTAQTQTALCVNQAMAAWAQEVGHSGFYYVDLDPAMSDPTQSTWTPLSGYVESGTNGAHTTPLGSSAIAWADAKIVNQLVPDWQVPTFTASDTYNATYNLRGNLLPNGILTGSSGTVSGTGCSGTAANSTTLSCANSGAATVVGSQTTLSDNTPAQVITISGNYSGTSPYVSFTQSVATPSNVNAGDIVQGLCYVGLTGASNISGLQVQLGDTESSTNYNYSTGGGDSTNPLPAAWATASLVPIATPQRLVGATPSAMDLAVDIQFITNASSTPVAATVTLRGCEIRKVIS